MVNANNVAGHRERYESLKRTLPPEELGAKYVGRGDVYKIGYYEREALSRHHTLDDAFIIDIGCGVGRLTRYLLQAPLRGYLGIDVVPEILAEAEAMAKGKPGFSFEIVESCAIPAADGTADIVCAFSVVTHLLDEEAFDYFAEAKRVLKPGGNFVVSFLDFGHLAHRKHFLAFVREHHKRRDVLKFLEKSTIGFFAEATGLSVIEYIDAGRPITATDRRPLLNGEPAPASFSFGQSIVWLQA